jgi:hypothetical protein
MARSSGKSAKAVNFSDRGQALAWFERQSHEACVALAVRSSLRVLPLIVAARGVTDFSPRVAFPILRACFVAWAIAEFPSKHNDLQSAAATATASAFAADATADGATKGTALDAVYAAKTASAAAAAAYTVHVADAAAAGADATYAAARATAAVDAAAAATIAAAVQADAVAIERGRTVAEIVAAPLWSDKMPERIAKAWDHLRTLLLGKAKSGDPWVHWYERVRNGRPSFREASVLAVASLTDEEWNEEPRPTAVNRRLAALLAQYTGQGARPESEAKTARQAEPQTGPDPASDARQSQKTDQRINDHPAEQRVETNIGQALRERRYQVQLALVAVVSLIDEKLQQLISSPPNSDEARRGWINEKSELEKLRGIVKRLQTDVADYLAGAKPEKAPVRSVKSFAEAVEDYWTKNHMKILEKGFNIGLFVTATLSCSLAGVEGTIAAICGTLIGGKPAIEALKAVTVRRVEAGSRVSGRRSHTNRPRV